MQQKQNPERAQRVKRLRINKSGRDFVVGDIHGCYDLLWESLKRVSFHPQRDRLLCVGDLIDRGPSSVRVERFLAQPWVHSVLGNHECMLLDMYEDGEPDADLLRAYMNMMGARNGMKWWLDVPIERQRSIIEAIRNLPYLIELETERGTVGLVHAEVPAGMNWQTFVARVESGDKNVITTATWGRDRVHSSDENGVAGIDRVFVGHTPQRAAGRLGNVYYVDTGAFLHVLNDQQAAHLTLADVCAKTQILTNPPDAVDGVNVLTDVPDSDQPFGSYGQQAPSPGMEM